jgi:hypothetical protein
VDAFIDTYGDGYVELALALSVDGVMSAAVAAPAPAPSVPSGPKRATRP